MKLAFVYSGQGAQHQGMGRDLYERYELVKSHFDQADEVFGSSLTNIIFNDGEALNRTLNAQPAIFTMSTALRELFKLHGIESEGVCGLSLGEYAAYYDAGVFDFEDGLRTIIHRAYFMEEATKQTQGAMVAMLGSYDAVNQLVETIDGLYMANINSASQIVVGGTDEACLKAVESASKFGIKRAIKLDTSGAFHTPMMEEARKPFEQYLTLIHVNEPQKPLFLNTTGKRFERDLKIEMGKQITNPVRFNDQIEAMINDGYDTFVELGPKDTLKRLIKKINRGVTVYHVEDSDTFEQALRQIKETSEYGV